MQRRCLDIADKLGLSDLLERNPRELSTGQAKRLTLAMLLVVEPPHLVLDEPYKGLDRDQLPSSGLYWVPCRMSPCEKK